MIEANIAKLDLLFLRTCLNFRFYLTSTKNRFKWKGPTDDVILNNFTALQSICSHPESLRSYKSLLLWYVLLILLPWQVWVDPSVRFLISYSLCWGLRKWSRTSDLLLFSVFPITLYFRTCTLERMGLSSNTSSSAMYLIFQRLER